MDRAGVAPTAPGGGGAQGGGSLEEYLTGGRSLDELAAALRVRARGAPTPAAAAAGLRPELCAAVMAEMVLALVLLQARL